jgi:hypothetical protein
VYRGSLADEERKRETMRQRELAYQLAIRRNDQYSEGSVILLGWGLVLLAFVLLHIHGCLVVLVLPMFALVHVSRAFFERRSQKIHERIFGC